MLHAVRRALILAVFSLAAVPGVAQAWYVDLSITGAGRIYETTDANELDEHCPEWPEEGFSSPSYTPTGTLGAFCKAGDASGDYAHGWVVRYVAEAAPGYRFDGWSSDGRSSPGPVICDGATNSSPNYSGTGCQFQIWENLQTRARFVDDTAPAMFSLSGPSAPVNGPATFTFSAASDPTFSHFECQVPGVHGWQTCTSGRQENPATSGTYTFEVRAVDHSSNRSSVMSREWTVDKVAPETTLLTSGPSGFSRSTTAQFEFSSTESGTFVCTLDGVSTTCGSPKSYTGLAQGEHTFTVAARDAAGNVDPSPSTRTFTVDTVAPNTSLAASGPNGPTNSPNAAFSFSSEPNASFTCSLNGEETPCDSGIKTYNGLPDGSYTFRVTARDQAGNEDPSPATRTFTVDTVAPETTLSAVGPSGSTTSRTARFEFSSPDGTATFRCSVDGAAAQPCSSPVELSGLSLGKHTFTVTAVDAATNADASPAARTWTVTNPPAPTTPPDDSDDTPPPSGDTGGTGGTGGSGGSSGPAGGQQPPVVIGSTTTQRSGGSGAGLGAGPTITGRSRGTARLDRRGRVTIPRLKVACPAACTVSVRITASKRRVLASSRVTPTRSGALRVKLSRKGRAAVKRARRLRTTVVVTVTPKGGGAKVTKRVTLTLRAR